MSEGPMARGSDMDTPSMQWAQARLGGITCLQHKYEGNSSFSGLSFHSCTLDMSLCPYDFSQGTLLFVPQPTT